MRSTLDSLNIVVPKNLFHDNCNNKLYGSVCGLTKTDWDYAASTSAASTTLFYLESAAFPPYKVDFDQGDSSSPLTVGMIIKGAISGTTALLAGIKYDDETTGTLYWYNQVGAGFQDDEKIDNNGVPPEVYVNGDSAEYPELFALGEIEITSGNNDGERRMVRTVFRFN
ncbi:unnamed protein product [marine sediment metagenome]|uniref:Uncharacterized protein n=1 Tax=marine sediment metagenome TaxID=412755 RepID=X0ZM21_9ZZZZ